jgi:hypothetical protein
MAIAENKKLERIIATPTLFKCMLHYATVYSRLSPVTAKRRAKGAVELWEIAPIAPPAFEGKTQRCYPPRARPAERPYPAVRIKCHLEDRK